MKNNKSALLIIDMQKGSFTTETPRFDTAGVVMRINELAAIFSERDLPVIFMQHDGTGSGAFEKNTPVWENLDELIRRPNDILIDKYANDVFYKSELQNKRSALHVNDLSITGCVTDFCVESTIQSALIKEYHIAKKCFRRGLGLFVKTAKFLNLALCLTGKLMSFYSQGGKTVLYY